MQFDVHTGSIFKDIIHQKQGLLGLFMLFSLILPLQEDMVYILYVKRVIFKIKKSVPQKKMFNYKEKIKYKDSDRENFIICAIECFVWKDVME